MNIRSRPTILSKRLTVAHFHSSEKEPVDKDKLVNLVIIGRRESKQLTTNGVRASGNYWVEGVARLMSWYINMLLQTH